jgi:hypothetical protein
MSTLYNYLLSAIEVAMAMARLVSHRPCTATVLVVALAWALKVVVVKLQRALCSVPWQAKGVEAWNYSVCLAQAE